MSAWAKQLAKQVKKHGKRNASWYCEWNEPNGTRRTKSCGPGLDGKRLADQMAERIKSQLNLGTYESDKKSNKTWVEFRQEYEATGARKLSVRGREEVIRSLNHFERHVKPKLLRSIDKSMVDQFAAKRIKDRGRNPGSTASPATINKDLRNLRTVLNFAFDLEYIDRVPKFTMEREPEKLPQFVTSEHFAAIYGACDAARSPGKTPSVFWRGLVTTAYMTGWRIGELLALKWEDVNLEAGTAITRHRDNKGKRDELVGLHPVVVEHLRPLRSFSPEVFGWEKSRRCLYDEFWRIQEAAGIWLPCPDAGDLTHGECTPGCHRYGFHDERRGFATANAENMTREALQALMRHRSASTTARYINYAAQLNPAVANLHVPTVLKSHVG